MKLSRILEVALNEQDQPQDQPQQQTRQPLSKKSYVGHWDIKVTPEQLIIYSGEGQNKIMGKFKSIGETPDTKKGIRNPYDNKLYDYGLTPDSIRKSFGFSIPQSHIEYLVSSLNSVPAEKKKHIAPEKSDMSVELVQNSKNPEEYYFKIAKIAKDNEKETKDTVYTAK